LFELENAAATKIQAGYRGHQDRKRVQHLKGQVAENIVIENEENQHVQGTLQINSDEYALKHSQPEVSSVELENAAATKIQASYRGHQDRKRVKHFKAELTYAKKADEIELDNTSAEKTIVYECDDLIRNAAARSNVTSAELENAAATKIQSGFRGHQDRKRVQHLRENNSASK
jgi:type II secretory pathway component HofQ